jgi:integrase/recombinase XerD
VAEIHWGRLPLARELAVARDWLTREAESGLSAPTLDAYSRAVERYLAWCRERRIRPAAATTEHVAAYLGELSAAGLRGATLLQRLVALRLFYAYVVERGLRGTNPAADVGASASRSILADARVESQKGPWVPREPEWQAVLGAARAELRRSRLMLAIAYEAALRREEVCGLCRADLDLQRAVLRVRDPDARPREVRVVALSRAVVMQCRAYLHEYARHGESSGPNRPIFLSESPRNRAEPISIWTWSKVVQGIAERANVPPFTTHTPRHLRLTDLARAGRDAAEIARFAGHSRPNLARPYLRLAEEQPWTRDRPIREAREEQLAAILFQP